MGFLSDRLKRRQVSPHEHHRIDRPDPVPAVIDLFVLRTGRGNWLAAESGGGEILMADLVTPETALLVCVPRGAPQASFLMANDGRQIEVEGDGLKNHVVTVRLKRLPDERVELRHPGAPMRYLGVITGAPAGKPNRVLFDRVGHPVLGPVRAASGRSRRAEPDRPRCP